MTYTKQKWNYDSNKGRTKLLPRLKKKVKTDKHAEVA